MNLDEARKILLRYTDWLKGRGNLSYLEHTPLPDFIERFFQEARPPEIKPEEAHQVIFCPHIGVDKTPVHYQYRLGKHDLRVCHTCYDNIRSELLDDLISTALKELFQEWRESKRKSAPHPDPFIG